MGTSNLGLNEVLRFSGLSQDETMKTKADIGNACCLNLIMSVHNRNMFKFKKKVLSLNITRLNGSLSTLQKALYA